MQYPSAHDFVHTVIDTWRRLRMSDVSMKSSYIQENRPLLAAVMRMSGVPPLTITSVTSNVFIYRTSASNRYQVHRNSWTVLKKLAMEIYLVNWKEKNEILISLFGKLWVCGESCRVLNKLGMKWTGTTLRPLYCSWRWFITRDAERICWDLLMPTKSL